MCDPPVQPVACSPLLQATAIADRWGATHYGLLSAPSLIVTALAP
jgi:hypothetical protein